jgi:hypothetical protein
MSDNHGSARAGARTVVIDLVVAALVFALGAMVGYESYRLGASWGSDGPQAGYFPFYIGLLICICSVVIFVQSFVRLRTDRRVFVTGGQFRQVLVILLPSTAYVFGVWLIGIYVSATLFIALFMKFAGHYSWLRSTVLGLAVSITAFVLFEIWFKIPLPKGPVEHLLGF